METNMEQDKNKSLEKILEMARVKAEEPVEKICKGELGVIGHSQGNKNKYLLLNEAIESAKGGYKEMMNSALEDLKDCYTLYIKKFEYIEKEVKELYKENSNECLQQKKYSLESFGKPYNVVNNSQMKFEIEKKLRNLKDYMPNCSKKTYELGECIADILPKKINSVNFYISSMEAVKKCLKGRESSVLSIKMYSELEDQILKITKAVCPSDLADDVELYYKDVKNNGNYSDFFNLYSNLFNKS
ncbi:hypothetical protein KAI32_00695 [Candidatus Pacearchaeota archaeon]|nr:hypothetical protein [Candidatus Pacearchaeota archaeon]